MIKEGKLKRSERLPIIKYEEIQTNMTPKTKLSSLFGLISCHKKGMLINKTRMALKISFPKRMLNQ